MKIKPNKKIFKSICLLTTALFLCIFLTGAAKETVTANKSQSNISSSTQKVKLFIGGDIMCQYNQQIAAQTKKGFQFDYAFDYVRSLMEKADIAIGNLETCVSPSNPLGKDLKMKYNNPYLNAPASFLPAVKNAGFDILIGSNNHNADTGIKGFYETINNIDKNKFKRTGIFKNEKERRYMIIKKNGIKIGLVAYSTFFNRSIKDFSPAQQKKYLNKYSKEKMLKDVRNMRKAGAEYIFVYYHNGKEYTNETTPKQRRIAREIASSGADYIICSHSHTVQPYAILKGPNGKKVPVMYGLGNYISQMSKTRKTTYTTLLSLTLTKKNGKVRLTQEGYYPLCTLKENPETGKKYQLIPCTNESLKTFKDPTIIETIKLARKEIANVVGKKIKQY